MADTALTWDENQELYYYTADKEMLFLKWALFLFLVSTISLILAVCARPHIVEQSNACFILSAVFVSIAFAAIINSLRYNRKHKHTLEWQYYFRKTMSDIISTPKTLKQICEQLERTGTTVLSYKKNFSFKFTKDEFKTLLLETDIDYDSILNNHKAIMKQLGSLSELPPLMY